MAAKKAACPYPSSRRECKSHNSVSREEELVFPEVTMNFFRPIVVHTEFGARNEIDERKNP